MSSPITDAAHVRSDSKYHSGEGVEVSRQAIEACPGCAIDERGIDQEKCQAYCKLINSYTPSPEVCGKCFYHDVE